MKKEQAAAAALLYGENKVAWKLKPEQKTMYSQIYKCDASKFVINCSRRLGKSFMLCVLADEYARQVPGSSIKYAAPSKRQVRDIVKPLFGKMLFDCPKGLRPWWNTMESSYFYPNGSRISVVGCDKNAIDGLRGEETHLALIDEAGMISESLDYIIKDIILPQTLTIDKTCHKLAGKIILASTPPKTPAHEFVRYIADAECSGMDNYVHMTIYENTMLTNEQILEYAIESGCKVKNGKIIKYSTTFRREYLAEVVTEETMAVVPEFNNEKSTELVKESERPEFCDKYVSMDVGMVDLTVVLFGYYDFERATLVIEDEIVLNYRDGLNSELLANKIKEKEFELWENEKPYLRIMDNDPIVREDLYQLHGLNFSITDKDNKEAAVNNMRVKIFNNKIEFTPKCKTLITHLKYGIWNKRKTSFDRSGEFGHFDAIDSLIYLCRNLNTHRNPFPDQAYDRETHFINPHVKKQENIKNLETAFKNALIPGGQ